MNWKEIRKNGEFLRYLPEIWQAEMKMPKWFRASSWLWTKDFPAFVAWAGETQEIHGLFDGERFMACVYIERQDDPKIAVIHFSAVEKIAHGVFVEKCSELRDILFHRGIRSIRGWTLQRNFALLRLMRGIGFREMQFFMDHGTSHAKVLRWQLMQVRTG